MSQPTPQTNGADEEALRIIITGGAGCIGFATIKALLNSHPDAIIHILDITTPPSLETYPFSTFAQHKDQIHFHKADITSPTSLTSIFDTVKPKVVIHTASIIPSAARKRQLSNEGLWKINVEGTGNVLDISERTEEVKVLVYTSSCDAVKPDSWMDFVNATEAETQHLKDRDAKAWDNEYARSKLTTSVWRMYLAMNNLLGLSSTDGESDGKESANRRAFFITDGTPKPFRELQEMIWRVVDDDPDQSYGKYTVIPVWLFKAILKFAGLFTKTAISPDDVGDAVSMRYYCIEEARRVLGYEPERNKGLEESMRDAAEWWRASTAESAEAVKGGKK